MQAVLRAALKPRWLSLLAAVLVLCAGFGWLGAWQFGVAQDKGAEQARREVASRPTAALPAVLDPQQPFPTDAVGRRIVAHGRYDPGRQVLVAQRLQHGRPGWWVVAALRTDDGAWLPVVRGWVRSPDDDRADPTRAPTGDVEVSGVLQPDDAPADGETALAPGQLAALDAAELVNRWGSPIYNGFVIMTAENPSVPSASGQPSEQPAEQPGQPERVPPPQIESSGIAWRNAAYAVQWWVFAGFALVLWWKMVSQDAREPAAGAHEKVAV